LNDASDQVFKLSRGAQFEPFFPRDSGVPFVADS